MELTAAIDTDGTGDYPSMQAAITAEAQDLTDGGGDTWTGTFEASAGTADSIVATIQGFITAAANFVTVVAKAGQEALQEARDAARYRRTAGLTISDDFVRVIGLQAFLASGATIAVISVGGSTDVRIDSCRLGVAGSAGGDRGITTNDGTLDLLVTNTIVDDAGTYGMRCFDVSSFTVHNCICVGATNGFQRQNGTMSVINSSSFNNTTDFGGTITVDFCASDDGTGTNAVAAQGSDFANEYVDPNNATPALRDFTPLNSGNVFHGGTTAATATDIAGVTWNDPATIGAAEFVAAGGVVPTSYYRTLMQGAA